MLQVLVLLVCPLPIVFSEPIAKPQEAYGPQLEFPEELLPTSLVKPTGSVLPTAGTPDKEDCGETSGPYANATSIVTGTSYPSASKPSGSILPTTVAASSGTGPTDPAYTLNYMSGTSNPSRGLYPISPSASASGVINDTYAVSTSLRTSYGSSALDPSALPATAISTSRASSSASVIGTGGYSSGLYPYPNSTALYDPTSPSGAPISTGGTAAKASGSALHITASPSGSGIYTITSKNITYPRPTATYRPRRPYSDYGLITINVTSRFTLTEPIPSSTIISGGIGALNATATRILPSSGSAYYPINSSLSLTETTDPLPTPSVSGATGTPPTLNITTIFDTFPPYPYISSSTSTGTGTDPSADATTAGTSPSSGFVTSIRSSAVAAATGISAGTSGVAPTVTTASPSTSRPVRVPTPSPYYEPDEPSTATAVKGYGGIAELLGFGNE